MTNQSKWWIVVLSAVVASAGQASADQNSVPSWVRGITIDEGAAVVLLWESVPDADLYRVYGIDGLGAKTLIEETLLTSSVVINVYPSYAVAAVVDGTEGDSVPAANCADVDIDVNEHPPVDVSFNCL